MTHENKPSLLPAGGRLLDVLEKRNDEWRIIKRTPVVDWIMRVIESADAVLDLAGLNIAGCRGTQDRSYRHFLSRS